MALLQRNIKTAFSLLTHNVKPMAAIPNAHYVACSQKIVCCASSSSLRRSCFVQSRAGKSTTTSSTTTTTRSLFSTLQQNNSNVAGITTTCAAPTFCNVFTRTQTGQHTVTTMHRCNLTPSRAAHTKSEGDQQFLEFLAAEIKTEKSDSTKQSLSISDFQINHQGSDVKLTKKHDDETVTVEFNVTHSVGSPNEAEQDMPGEPSDDFPEMISQPDFTVTLQKDGLNSKLCLQCSFVGGSSSGDTPEDELDVFSIDEVAMVEGEWNNSTYSVSGDILDPNMYDMLMLMLEERGINHSSFCDQLIQYSTEYERGVYIDMLQSMHDFVQK